MRGPSHTNWTKEKTPNNKNLKTKRNPTYSDCYLKTKRSFRNTFGFSLLKEWLLSDHLLVVEYSISHILVHLIIFQHFYTYFIAGNMETYQRVSSKLKLEKVGDQYVGKPNSNLLKSRTNTGETDTGGPVKTGNRISLNFTSGETFLLPFLIKMGFSLFPSHPSHLWLLLLGRWWTNWVWRFVGGRK